VCPPKRIEEEQRRKDKEQKQKRIEERKKDREAKEKRKKHNQGKTDPDCCKLI